MWSRLTQLHPTQIRLLAKCFTVVTVHCIRRQVHLHAGPQHLKLGPKQLAREAALRRVQRLVEDKQVRSQAKLPHPR